MAKDSAQIAGMDQRQFDRMYRDCFRLVVACLISKFHFREDDAMDIATNAFVETFQKSGSQYDPEKEHKPCSYIRWLANKRALDFLRSDKRQKKLREDLGKADPPTFDPSKNDLHERLHLLIHELPPKLKRLCELKIAGFAAKEMASRLGITVPEVRKQEVQLRKTLSETAARHGMKKEDLD